MAIDKTGKTLVEYSVKNGQYQIGSGAVKSLTFLDSITITRNVNTQSIYGDGEEQDLLISEPSVTASLVMTAKDADFEKDLGFVAELAVGSGASLVRSLPTVNIYTEIYFKGVGETAKVKKVWFLNCRVTPPNEAYNQSTDSVTANNVEYPMTVLGVNRKAEGGASDYVDATTGDTIKQWKVSCIPTDTGYATFGDSVPVPTQPSGE